jgi:hypothetical protein
MGVFTGQVLYLGEEVGAGVLGGGPFVAVLEDQFADLGEEGGVAVGGTRAQLGPEEEGAGHGRCLRLRRQERDEMMDVRRRRSFNPFCSCISMMARATRSSTADLKRKRSPVDDATENNDHAPNKQPRTDDGHDISEPTIDGHAMLEVLETEDKQGLLDRVFPSPDSQQTVSLRALLTTPSPLSAIKAAINHLLPMSSLPRAKPSQTAAQQIRFCNLALSLLEQVPPSEEHLKSTSILPESPEQSPQRPKPSYALVQHLPSGDWWTSLASPSSPSNLQTANAELAAVLPLPSSSSSEKPIPTLGSYSTKPPSQRKPPLAPRRVTTGAFLDYGLYSSFAPSFDQDGELVGRNQLGQALLYREEKKHMRDAVRRERLEGIGTIVDVTPEQPEISDHHDDPTVVPDLELEALLPPEEVTSIKAALGSLELEKSVQRLLERNQKALERLGELQRQRLTNHPTSKAEEDSEEWETGTFLLTSTYDCFRTQNFDDSSSHIGFINSTRFLTPQIFVCRGPSHHTTSLCPPQTPSHTCDASFARLVWNTTSCTKYCSTR